MQSSFSFTKEYALEQDKSDKLASFRKKFLFPQHNGKDVIYFCGNSLGLQPASTHQYIQQELDDWAKYAVEAHFMAKNPWYSYHEMFARPLAKLTGALPDEVVAITNL